MHCKSKGGLLGNPFEDLKGAREKGLRSPPPCNHQQPELLGSIKKGADHRGSRALRRIAAETRIFT